MQAFSCRFGRLKGYYTYGKLGSVDISAQPDERTDEVDEPQIGAIQLVKAGEDAAKVLEFVDAAFDEVALAVQPRIVCALDLGRLMRWNHGFAALGLHRRDQIRSGIAAIRDHAQEGEAVEQRMRLGAVMALSGGQEGS